MPRKARKRGPKGTPWYRRFNDTWYMPKINGKARPILDTDGLPVKGHDNKEAAFKVWHEIVAREQAATKALDNPVTVIFEEFLEYTEKRREPETYGNYVRILQSFKDRWPELTVRDLSVIHTDAWVAEHANWSDSTKWTYLTVLLSSLNWAAKPEVRLIPSNPLRGLERPRKKSRGGEAKVSDEAHQTLMARVPWDFKQILLALKHTGTRPSNVCRVTAKNFFPDKGEWVFDASNTEPGTSVHKTFKKTGRALVVPLTPEVVELCKQLAEQHPTGPLFRTRRGNPWHPGYIEKRFRTWTKILRDEGHEMPERLFAYCYRHQLATDLLERGESETLVAAVMGHKGTRVLHEHYSGITGKNRAVREMLLRNVKATPEEVSVSAGAGARAPNQTPTTSGDGAGSGPAAATPPLAG